jgi:hypothetical protein
MQIAHEITHEIARVICPQARKPVESESIALKQPPAWAAMRAAAIASGCLHASSYEDSLGAQKVVAIHAFVQQWRGRRKDDREGGRERGREETASVYVMAGPCNAWLSLNEKEFNENKGHPGGKRNCDLAAGQLK